MKAKKILVFLLTLTLLTGIIPQTAFAESTVYIDLSTVSADGTGYTCTTTTVNSKTEYLVTITGSGTYSLTGTIDQHKDATHPTHVVVSATNANIILNGVNVSIFNFSPLSINTNSTVNLTLADGTTNILSGATSELSIAGVHVPSGATLNVDGTGTLMAYGGLGAAGIGGGSGDTYSGTIKINNGEINAFGGSHAAGIGGDGIGDTNNASGNGTVIISGKSTVVKATAGDNGTGIGGGIYGTGGIITINGGTVIASSTTGAGIGHTASESGGTVTLNHYRLKPVGSICG
jgi:hypothetical protein